jgi:hypothetical protein
VGKKGFENTMVFLFARREVRAEAVAEAAGVIFFSRSEAKDPQRKNHRKRSAISQNRSIESSQSLESVESSDPIDSRDSIDTLDLFLPLPIAE